MWKIAALVLVLAQFSVSALAQAPSRPLDINQIRVPASFRISVFARMPSAPRFMVFAPSGNLLVSLMNAGRIASVSPDGQVATFAQGLAQPHGLAVLGNDLYVAEQRQVRVYRDMDPARSQVLVPGLPAGGHSSRTVTFGPDGKMYVSVGSSCNLCNETDERRAAVVRYNPDGTGQEVFARGLRNSVGLRWHPVTGELWATDNGFDNFGDDRPPEEINIVRQGGNYGWPFCWADRLSNPTFPNNDPAYCQNTIGAAVQMQAHSAPLGFDFYTGTRFPTEYRGDAFVAFHGSWNRSVHTGYKIVRVRAGDGQPGALQDFATGWLENQTASGRPVDVLTGPDGGLYVSDDRANVIYRITYESVSLNPGGVTNAASYSSSVGVAPGGLISIFGQGLYSGTYQAGSLPLADRIEGLAVTIGGRPAPLLYASDRQINVQAPVGVVGPATLVVTRPSGSDSASITVLDAAPGLFSQDASGAGAGAIRNGSSGGLVTSASPARVGDTLEIFATALGATTEEVPAGAAAPLGRVISTRATPVVTIGGIRAEVPFSGLAPGFAGLYQINARIPPGVPSGAAVPVVLSISGQTSNTVTVAIQ